MSAPRRGTVLAVCGWALMACVVMAACSGKTTQAGGLEVVVRTDMHVPAAFDTVHVEISQQAGQGKWNLLLKNDLFVKNDGSLPTTISPRRSAISVPKSCSRCPAPPAGFSRRRSMPTSWRRPARRGGLKFEGARRLIQASP